MTPGTWSSKRVHGTIGTSGVEIGSVLADGLIFGLLFAAGLEWFESPALLWGLALGAAPLIIHFFNKRAYRETSWAAMRFLLEAVRKNSRRLRIEQLILLAVRTLILLLVVLALAEPLSSTWERTSSRVSLRTKSS